MPIKRIDLVNAINIARKSLNNNLYKELLNIYYRLLEQESVDNNFITNFFFYEKVSTPALQLINN